MTVAAMVALIEICVPPVARAIESRVSSPTGCSKNNRHVVGASACIPFFQKGPSTHVCQCVVDTDSHVFPPHLTFALVPDREHQQFSPSRDSLLTHTPLSDNAPQELRIYLGAT